MLRQLINKWLVIVCLSFIVILAFVASAHHQDFRVTEAFLKADDARLSGPCPLRVTFNGYITTNGPGTVRYTFTRSDGATAPIYQMEFKEAGQQAVSTDWTLGDAGALPSYEGWQAIKMLSPNEMESSHETGSFSIICEQQKPVGQPSTPAKEQFVACPLKEARTEVTTPLPKPWWNTPQVGRLERVSVQTIGGNRTLVCEYWAYGRTVGIMREFPKGTTDCSAEGNGFVCH